ncbi:lipopolysaccharide biosynthesis protein [Williamsia serinedens]|uniref:Membrane protein involved in the export of O-antigen and teichoic acid n=1 Tax=Williamsia serinedens TaxID=391736 RepID=A0ABT1H3V9_9NOCA|nr:hypothetical protein [Williamsia serinedens]MCP2161915.1 Membrane protein involved in the export of O-antigen and teichoic acid [Williamsia serinedens]
MLAATLVVLAAGTSVAQFGIMMVAYSAALIVGLVAGGGAPARALRTGGGASGRRLLPSLFVSHTVPLTVLGVGMLAVAWTAGWPVAVVVGLTLGLSDSFQNYAQSHLAGLQMHTATSALVIAQRAVPLVLVCMAPEPLVGALIGFAAMGLLAIAAPAVVVAVGEWKGIRPTGSWGFWSYSLTGILFMLQVPLVGWLGAGTVVAFFALGARLVGPVTLISVSLSTVVIPQMVTAIGTPRLDVLYRQFRRLCWAYLVLVVAGSVPGAYLIVAVLGPRYDPAVPFLVGMAVGAGLSACSQAANALLIAVHRPWQSTAAIAAGGAVSLVIITALCVSGLQQHIWVSPIVGETVVLAAMSRAARVALAEVRTSAEADDTVAGGVPCRAEPQCR